MLDTLTVIFWSITYTLIIIAGFKSHSIKQISMPYIAGVLNFSWEVCAVHTSHGFWGHLLWLGLDFFIIYFGFRFLASNKERLLYTCALIGTTILLYTVFKLPDGMLLSVFMIDLIMAICYIIQSKKVSPHLKTSIALSKLLGDTFAGLLCARESIFIAIIAILVFLCNLFYFCYCLEEQSSISLKSKKKYN